MSEEISPAVAIASALTALRAHLALILLVALASVGGAAAWLFTHDPRYEAQTEILVTPVAINDLTFVDLPVLRSTGPDPRRHIVTAAQLLDTPLARRQAAAAIGASVGEVDSMAAIEADEDANIVAVTGTSVDPDRAARIANSFAQAALEVRGAQLRPLVRSSIRRVEAELDSLEDSGSAAAQTLRSRLASLRTVEAGSDPTLAIAEPATAPTSPTGPARWMTMGVALIGGLALGALAAFLIELLVPRRAQQSVDLTDVMPLPVLAHVPNHRRFSLSVDGAPAPPVREAFRSLRGRLQFGKGVETGGDGGYGRIVLMTSALREDGRTTAALDLADVITAGGQTAILLEFDLRAPAIAGRLGIDPRRTLNLVSEPGARLADGLTVAPGIEELELAVAPARRDLTLVESLLPRMPQLVQVAAERADWVIIDTPALGQVMDALPLLQHVDDVVVVARMGHTTQPALRRLADLLQRVGAGATGYLVIGGDLSEAVGYYGYGAAEATRPGGRPSRFAGRTTH